MSLARYSPLPQKEQGEKVDAESISTELPYRTRIKSSYWPYSVLLCLSVFLNIIQFTGSHAYTSSTFTKTPTEQGGRALNNWGSEPSEIMGLIPTLTKPFASSSGANGDGAQNQSAHDDIWDWPDFDPNLNFVAMDHEWAAAQGLPPSQPWPWDGSKGIYLVHGMHLLHCTKALHQTLDQLRYGKPQTWAWNHLEHCTHMLREEVMCSANDNLVYTGRMKGQEDIQIPIPGLDQPRKCRNWSHLLDWIRERSACYWNIPHTGPDFHESERYKFCPDGRKPWEKEA